MNRVLENNRLRVTVSDDGAELVSVWDKKRNAERIWRGDKAVWGRHAGKYRRNKAEILYERTWGRIVKDAL